MYRMMSAHYGNGILRNPIANMTDQKEKETALYRSGSKPFSTLTTTDQNKEFKAVFPDIVKVLVTESTFKDIPEASESLEKLLNYNVPGGKNTRGLFFLDAYKILENPENLTSENIKLAYIMGWCIEMFQSYLLIYDDIIDGSSMRRGAPCWYKVDGVGISAINDAAIVQASMYNLLKIYFKTKPYYKNIYDLFNMTLFESSIGQYMELKAVKKDKLDLDKFTFEIYNSIIKYKTAYYTIHMPIAIAMFMCGIDDPKLHREAECILLDIGKFFQVQDDYLDCFEDSAVTGKIGNDIETGKCSWLAVMALQKANSKQRRIMEKYYGSSKVDDVKKIRELYNELNILAEYVKYEETNYEHIRERIRRIPEGLPQSLFTNSLDKLYKRKR